MEEERIGADAGSSIMTCDMQYSKSLTYRRTANPVSELHAHHSAQLLVLVGLFEVNLRWICLRNVLASMRTDESEEIERSYVSA